MSRADWIALLLSLLAIPAALLIAVRVFEGVPHLEDEIAYVWQARTLAAGHLSVDSPEYPRDFLVPFVVDYQGMRFGKYPLGWPAMLSLGVRLGVRVLVNPALAALGVWFTYRLGKKVLGETVGILAACLTLTSPFFLLISGSLLAHPLGFALSTAFAYFWWAAFVEKAETGKWLPALTAGCVLGTLALTRPFTAAGIALPFAIHGLFLMIRGPKDTRLRILALGGTAGLLSGLHFLWQYAVTGDPLLNPYTLWWEYDRIGFGPGIGVTESGHTLEIAWRNTLFSLKVGSRDLFGWGNLSWIMLPLGAWATRKNGKALLTAAPFFSVFTIYLAYWVSNSLLGPRYWYEGLFSLTLLTAAGVCWLAGWPTMVGESWRRFTGWHKARPLGVFAILLMLVTANLVFYLPPRMATMKGLYGIDRARIAPFQTAQAQTLAPAVFVVHSEHWTEYGALLELEDPFLTSPFIFTFGPNPEMERDLGRLFPGYDVYYYYPDKPYVFNRVRESE